MNIYKLEKYLAILVDKKKIKKWEERVDLSNILQFKNYISFLLNIRTLLFIVTIKVVFTF